MADTGVIGYFWLRFIEYRLDKWKYFSNTARLLLLLPVFVLLFFSATAPLNHLLFYIDALNIYHRGDLYPLQLIISYGYLGAASFHVASELRFVKTTSQRNALLFLLSFLFFPVTGGIISVLCCGLPAVWPASTLSLLLLYMISFTRSASAFAYSYSRCCSIYVSVTSVWITRMISRSSSR